jgi:hypothetical protein
MKRRERLTFFGLKKKRVRAVPFRFVVVAERGGAAAGGKPVGWVRRVCGLE